MEQSACKSNSQVLFHTKSLPLVGPLQDVAMRETYIIVKTYLPEVCILHFAIFHVLPLHVVMNKFKMFLAIVFHTIPHHAYKMYAHPHPSISWKSPHNP